MTVNIGNALYQVDRIAKLCRFIEGPEMKETVDRSVPVCMPRDVGSLGFDTPMWAGLGVVGLWASLDAYADRENLNRNRCLVCGRKCVVAPLQATGKLNSTQLNVLGEIEDLRHLFAHNFAGVADPEYWTDQKGKPRPRHLLSRGMPLSLLCGSRFDGASIVLDVSSLRYYSEVTREIFECL